MADTLAAVSREVVACRLCPRLVRYREAVARTKKREFRDDGTWGRGVPGFGDPGARLVVVGLAPAAHGSNRTGRVFTGDRSAAFLGAGLPRGRVLRTNLPPSGGNDGLHYRDLYLTAAVRCAPPDNRPTPAERGNCAPFLERELRLLTETRAIVAASGGSRGTRCGTWSRASTAASARTGRSPTAPVCFLGPGRPMLWGSYHPSPQNTNTGRLTMAMLVDLLNRIRASYEPSAAMRTRHP